MGREHSQSLASGLGVRIKKEFETGCGVVAPEAKLRWLHEFLDDDYEIDAAFSGYPASAFTVGTDAAARDSAAVGLGMAWAIGNNLAFALAYDAAISNDWTQHAGSLGLKYRW